MSEQQLTQDARISALRDWLQTLSPQGLALQADSLRPASADASSRRYFRLDAAEGASLIAMDAPPPEDTEKFARVGALFASCNLRVPRVLAADHTQGFLLLDDFGSTTYLHQLSADNAHHLYMQALAALVQLQRHSRPGVLPEYDRAFMQRELDLFPEWFIKTHLQFELSDKQRQDLDKCFELILAQCCAQPQVFMHRDYHSRNLMAIDGGAPGVLDFQDAVYGPITYDCVSLLRDAYVQWDEEMVLDWLIRYWEQAKRMQLPVHHNIDQFYRDFEYMGLQRHLKILGIFCRLNYRDGKPHYLQDLPLVLDYVRKTVNRYSELKPLARLLDVLEQRQPQYTYSF
ncbi:phosphotransferase [Massilia sp. W12]|uniref:aminoglycoside phosphotransferase family protein n=1 Tax=Massilia sp. W12 TaxID=3126507 RepID=UPI0030CE3394